MLPDLPAGEMSMALLPEAMQFVEDQHRHCKPILALGEGGWPWLDALGLSAELGAGMPDPGIVLNRGVGLSDDSMAAFEEALGRHRHHEREAAKV